jgi:hypothetical protein
VVADDPEPAPSDERPDPGERDDPNTQGNVGLVAYQEPPPPTELDRERGPDSVSNVGEV